MVSGWANHIEPTSGTRRDHYMHLTINKSSKRSSDF
jgi:hypothetical protein